MWNARWNNKDKLWNVASCWLYSAKWPNNNKVVAYIIIIIIIINILTAIGLTPGGSSTVHIYTQTIHRTTQLTTLVGRLSGIRTHSGQTKINDEQTAWKLSLNGKSVDRAPSLRIIPWHLPYNWGKSMEKPQSGSSCIQFGCCVSFEHACVCSHVHVCMHRCPQSQLSPNTRRSELVQWWPSIQQECRLKLGNPDMMLMFPICPYR